jgi:hypothetical protein
MRGNERKEENKREKKKQERRGKSREERRGKKGAVSNQINKKHTFLYS